MTFQAEDEIAGIGAALGASFGGRLGVTTTSGPGIALKSETIGLAVSLELPLVVVDVQRGGPSTGLPDQDRAVRPAAGDVRAQWRGAAADRRAAVARRLLRRGDRGSPDRGDLPDARHAAVRRLPRERLRALAAARRRRAAAIDPDFATEPNHETESGDREFWPYQRDPETLARPWAIPGTPGLEHRIGGLEKADGHGNISYDPANHDLMVRTRQAKVDRVADTIRPLEVDDPDGDGHACWCSAGARRTDRSAPPAAGVRNQGCTIAQAHLRHLNPFPHNLGDVLRRYDRVSCPR